MSYNKYQRLVHQVSTDGGRTWTTAVPVQYARGELIERNSLDCQPSYRWVVISDEFICAGTEGYDKYEKLKKQVSLDGGTIWTDVVPLETKAGNLIQRNSVDCGAAPEYKWEVDHNRIVCDGTTAYYALVEYVSYDNRATWTETGNVQKSNVVYQENYPDCIQTVYRWIDTGNYVCVGTSKYAEQKQQVSYNSGTTWQDTGSTRAGSLIEVNSVDCGATNVEWRNTGEYICLDLEYRWVTVSGEYICSGFDKYAVEKEQLYDSGTDTWNDTGNTRTGSLIEADSSDCGYGDRWVEIGEEITEVSGTEDYWISDGSYNNYYWELVKTEGGLNYLALKSDTSYLQDTNATNMIAHGETVYNSGIATTFRVYDTKIKYIDNAAFSYLGKWFVKSGALYVNSRIFEFSRNGSQVINFGVNGVYVYSNSDYASFDDVSGDYAIEYYSSPEGLSGFYGYLQVPSNSVELKFGHTEGRYFEFAGFASRTDNNIEYIDLSDAIFIGDTMDEVFQGCTKLNTIRVYGASQKRINYIKELIRRSHAGNISTTPLLDPDSITFITT